MAAVSLESTRSSPPSVLTETNSICLKVTMSRSSLARSPKITEPILVCPLPIASSVSWSASPVPLITISSEPEPSPLSRTRTRAPLFPVRVMTYNSLRNPVSSRATLPLLSSVTLPVHGSTIKVAEPTIIFPSGSPTTRIFRLSPPVISATSNMLSRFSTIAPAAKRSAPSMNWVFGSSSLNVCRSSSSDGALPITPPARRFSVSTRSIGTSMGSPAESKKVIFQVYGRTLVRVTLTSAMLGSASSLVSISEAEAL